MDYTIFKTSGLRKTRIATCISLDDAEFQLSRLGAVIAFERDFEGRDAADAAVLIRNNLEIFAIERTI